MGEEGWEPEEALVEVVGMGTVVEEEQVKLEMEEVVMEVVGIVVWRRRRWW